MPIYELRWEQGLDPDLPRPRQIVNPFLQWVKDENGNALFSEMQKRGEENAGFILTGWENPKTKDPEWFFNKTKGKRKKWVKFDDVLAQEHKPAMYLSLHTILVAREQENVANPHLHIGISFWIRPYVDPESIKDYLQMVDAHLPRLVYA